METMTNDNQQVTGWATIDGQKTYLTNSGGLNALGLNVEAKTDIAIGNLSRYALPAPPADPRPAIQASLDFLTLAPLHVSLPLWAAMYAAPLAPFKPLGATLWLHGPARSGKTAISHLALAHFGPTFVDGRECYPPQDWESPPAILEQAMFVVKDAPIVIDGLVADPTASFFKARQATQHAQAVVRNMAMSPSADGRRPSPARGLVIATARNRLPGQSIALRTIHIPVEAGQIIQVDESENHLDTAQHQAAAGLYAQAMAGYVTWLARNWKRNEGEIPGQIDRISRAKRPHFPAEISRVLSGYFGVLATAISLALQWAGCHEVLSRQEINQRTNVYHHALTDLLASQRVQQQA